MRWRSVPHAGRGAAEHVWALPRERWLGLSCSCHQRKVGFSARCVCPTYFPQELWKNTPCRPRPGAAAWTGVLVCGHWFRSRFGCCLLGCPTLYFCLSILVCRLIASKGYRTPSSLAWEWRVAPGHPSAAYKVSSGTVSKPLSPPSVTKCLVIIRTRILSDCRKGSL